MERQPFLEERVERLEAAYRDLVRLTMTLWEAAGNHVGIASDEQIEKAKEREEKDG
jgi:hypothetical protein